MKRVEPIGSQILIDGLFYKVGDKGLVFYHTGGEWMKSNKLRHVIEKAIRDKKRGIKK